MDAAPTAVEIFCSYADEDEVWWQKLEIHLGLLRQQGLVSLWHHRLITPGSDSAHAIDRHLETASVILLFVSANFFASDYYYSFEMQQRVLARHEAGEARVIPILLRPVDWQGSLFARLQALPLNAKSITEWKNQDLAFKHITIQIRKVINELQGPQMATNAQQVSISPQVLQASSEFRRCRKKVSELKSVHHMLHEVELQLEGLSATVQLFTHGEKDRFDYIEIAWRQTILKIDDLTYFAAEEMEVLEDERFNVESETVRGASWIKDLFILQRSLDEEIKDRNIDVVKSLSNELLWKCRSHLYSIDKRLLSAIKELVLSSDRIMR